MITRWIKAKPSGKKNGRPFSIEFDQEVLQRCYNEIQMNASLQSSSSSCSSSSAAYTDSKKPIFSYNLVKKHATETLNQLYPHSDDTTTFNTNASISNNHGNDADEGRNVRMVAKWKLNNTTKDLKFSNKWVHGFLQRNKIEGSIINNSDTGGGGDVTNSGTVDIINNDEEEEDDSDDDGSDKEPSLNDTVDVTNPDASMNTTGTFNERIDSAASMDIPTDIDSIATTIVNDSTSATTSESPSIYIHYSNSNNANGNYESVITVPDLRS